MRNAYHFRGPMTPDAAPPIATRHLCYGGLFGGGGGSPPPQIIQQAPPLPVYEPMPAPVLPAPVAAPPPVYDVPEVVAPPPVPVMPIADPQAAKREETRKLAAARSKRTTRQSTIIGDDTLG